MKTKKHKFKVGQEVVYHAGNWKYIVGCSQSIGGKFVYALSCNEDDCEECHLREIKDVGPHLEMKPESDLIDYELWCRHYELWCRHTEKGTCKICCN